MKKRIVISAAVAALILFSGCEKRESESVRHEPQSAEKMQSVTEPTKAMEERGAEEKAVEESTAEQQEAQKGETEAEERPITEKVTEAAKEAEQKASEIAESVKEGAEEAASAAVADSSKPAGLDAEALYKSKCAGCHGAKAEKHALGKSNVIAGQPAEELLKKLDGYKNGTYGGAMKSIMASQAASLDDSQKRALADYISGLK